jgi:hypothetical protein
VSIPALRIILTAFSPQIKILSRANILAAAIIFQVNNPSYRWTPVNTKKYTLQSIYQCVLTGIADGLDDLIIPISSFQATLRRGDLYFYPRFNFNPLLIWWPYYPLLIELSCVIPGSIDYIVDIMDRTHGEIVINKGYKYSDGTINTEEIVRVTYESLQIKFDVNGNIADFVVGQIDYSVDSVLQTMKVTEAGPVTTLVYPTVAPTEQQADAYWGFNRDIEHPGQDWHATSDKRPTTM